MSKQKEPEVLIHIERGIPTLVRNTTGRTVEIRDYDPGEDAKDPRPKKNSDGEVYFPYRWPNGRVDKG